MVAKDLVFLSVLSHRFSISVTWPCCLSLWWHMISKQKRIAKGVHCPRQQGSQEKDVEEFRTLVSPSKVPSDLTSSLKSLPPKCLTISQYHDRLVTKHLTLEPLRATSQTASVL